MTHLPWFFFPELACWSCRKPNPNVNRLRSRHLSRNDGGFIAKEQCLAWLEGMRQLLEYEASAFGVSVVQLHEAYTSTADRPGNVNMSPIRVILLSWLEQHISMQASRDVRTLLKLPSSLLFWDAQASILARMTSEERAVIKHLDLPLPVVGKELPAIVAADGHCHLASCLKKISRNSPEEEAYE